MSERESERRAARDLYERRSNPDEWDDEEVAIEVRPTATAVVSCRLARDEFLALEQAARAAQETISEYVRKAIVMRRTSGSASGSASAIRQAAIVRLNALDFDPHFAEALRPMLAAG